MSSIKAIETRYAGCLFRSRLEARWAVFLDALGIRWDYEPQGFVLDGVHYLPDFFLHRQQCWLEIKPRATETKEDWRLCKLLAEGTGKPVYMLQDELCPLGFDQDENVIGSHRGWHPPGVGYAEFKKEAEFMDGCCTWGQCARCGLISIDHCGQHFVCTCVCSGPDVITKHRIFAGGIKGVENYCKDCKGYLWADKPFFPHETHKDDHSDRLLDAYTAAKSARFEFGQSGRML